MYSPEERDLIREKIVTRAQVHPGIVAAAAVGSTATGGDRWSDLDLSFAVAPDSNVAAQLADWSAWMRVECDCAVLFDLAVERTVYRVFLAPGALQIDLSFTPAAEFGARTPRYRLLFGEDIERPFNPPADLSFNFGLAVHHLVRTHVCIERGRFWQAEHWLHEARDEALTLACHQRGMDVNHARGFDALPDEVHALYAQTLVTSLTPAELRRALAIVAAGLLDEGAGLSEEIDRLRPMLAEIIAPARQ